MVHCGYAKLYRLGNVWGFLGHMYSRIASIALKDLLFFFQSISDPHKTELSDLLG